MSNQTFYYQESPITFNRDGEVMVNATEMAKPFGKYPADFMRLDQTQEFCSVLEAKLNMGNPIIKKVTGRHGGGTWLHQKLALKFAAWLSPDFELWVYDRIEELLTTGRTQIKPISDIERIAEGYKLLMVQVEQTKEQLQIAESANEILTLQQEKLTATVKQMAPKAHMIDAIQQHEKGITTSTIAKQLGMAAKTLNKKLHDLGVQYKIKGDDKWVLYAKYQDCGYTIDDPYEVTNPETGVTKVYFTMKWTGKGLLFVHSLINPKAKAA